MNNPQEIFPSAVHKNIWLTLANIIPLEESLTCAFQQEAGDDMVRSCNEYHAFYTELLTDMYQNPDEYRLNAGMIESVLQGRKFFGFRFIHGVKAVKKCATELHKNHINFLRNIGANAVIDGDSLALPRHLFDSLVKKSIPNKASDYLAKPIERVMMLERVGFYVQHEGDMVRIVSKHYPHMFPALSEIAKKDYFEICPFQCIVQDFSPDYNCATRLMNDDSKKVLNEIAKHMKQYKVKIEYKPGGITWHMKGKPLVTTGGSHSGVAAMLRWGDTSLPVGGIYTTVRGIYAWNDPSYFLAAIENTSEKLKQYYTKHLNYCFACSGDGHLGGFYNIYGKRKRLCAGVGFRDVDFKNENLPYIKQLIDIRVKLLKDGTDNIRLK